MKSVLKQYIGDKNSYISPETIYRGKHILRSVLKQKTIYIGEKNPEISPEKKYRGKKH